MADEQPIASRDWHTRAIVRILETTTRLSVNPWREHTYQAGEEVEMVQWGRAGRPIDRSTWWTSYDIDGAFIVESDKTEIVRILDEIAPIESEAQPSWKDIEAQAQRDLESVVSDEDAYKFIDTYFLKELRHNYLQIYRSDRREMGRTPRQAIENLLSLPPL